MERKIEELEYGTQDLPTSLIKSSKLPQAIVNTSIIKELIKEAIKDKDKDITQLQTFTSRGNDYLHSIRESLRRLTLM